MNQWRLLCFLVISVFTVLVYYPSLWHTPRSDQIVYFFVTANRQDWASLAISCFDLNRWGTFAPGDERLFRPMLYFILGSEKYLFGYNFWLWQAVGIFLHLTVIWTLLKLLWRIVPGLAAFACALFFAVLWMNMEMVIWSHIHSYLVFVIATLIVLDQVYACIETEGKEQARRMVIIALCFLVAGFIYETANIFAVCVAIFLRKQKFSWIILLPPALYILCDVLNLNAHHMVGGMKGLDIFQGIRNVAAAFGFWSYSALWPGFIQMYFDARNKITEGSFNLMISYLSIIPVLIALMAARPKLGRLKMNFILLVLVMLFFYALVIVMGRGQHNSVGWILTQNAHYYYPFWALMMIIVGLLISALNDQRFTTALIIILVVLSVINGIKLYEINEVQAKGDRAGIRLVRSVQELIKENNDVKGFSFYVAPDYPGNYLYSDNYGRRSSFIGMLFPQYYKEISPKYIFDHQI